MDNRLDFLIGIFRSVIRQESEVDGVIKASKPVTSPSMNTANLRSAVRDAADADGNGGRVEMGAGNYELNGDCLQMQDLNAPQINGVGGRTRLIYRGLQGGRLVGLANVRNPHLSNLILDCGGVSLDAKPRAAIQVWRAHDGGVVPTMTHLSNIVIAGQDRLDYPLILGGAIDKSVDFLFAEHCDFSNYGKSGVLYENATQSYADMFTNVRLNGGIGAQYGLEMAAQCGGIRWLGGFMNNHEVDIRAGRSNDTLSFDGLVGEGSKRFLVHDVTEGGLSVSLRNGRWAGDKLHADGRAIIMENFAHVEIFHYKIGDGASPTAPLTLDFKNMRGDIGGGVTMLDTDVFSSADRVFPHDLPLLVNCSQYTDQQTQAIRKLVA